MDNVQYKCSKCGQIHDELPAIAFNAPLSYSVLSESEKREIAELKGDFCIIRHSDQTDRFIRCTLFQKIADHCDYLHYGLWVSLSEASYNDYSVHFNDEQHEVSYFGWLNNALPQYSFDESIPTTVFTKPGNDRPEIIPHQDFDHPFVRDYYNGITLDEAKRRIQELLSPPAPTNPDQ